MVGMVTAVQETGLLLTILTVETGQIRDLDQTKINVSAIPLVHDNGDVDGDDDDVVSVLLDLQNLDQLNGNRNATSILLFFWLSECAFCCLFSQPGGNSDI